MKKYLLFPVLLFSVLGFSQSVNDYQFVIVPVKFSIFKENDRFRMNSTTKLLLEKYGFKTFYSTDKLPSGIGDNCDRLYVDLVEAKDFLQTKIKIVLKDCTEKVVYETDFGKSREKDFAIAYNMALREAGKSFDKLNYKYNGKKSSDADIAPAASKPESEVVFKPTTNNTTPTSSTEPFYFAQPTADGFQVVNNEPKVIMKLFNTSQKNVFIATKDNSNGVVINKNGQWLFEYYQNGKLVSETVNLKF